VFAIAVGVLADLARAEIVWRDRATFSAIGRAWHWLWRDWRRLLAAAMWRAVAFAVVMLMLGRLVLACCPSWPALAVGLAISSAAVPVALRASWLHVLRASDRAHRTHAALAGLSE
jgi:hypothetical protein